MDKILIKVKHSKSIHNKSVNLRTGTRFKSNTNQLLAFDLITKYANINKGSKYIKGILAGYKKENGRQCNLDATYFNYIIASHPEYFEVYDDGSVVVIKERSDEANEPIHTARSIAMKKKKDAINLKRERILRRRALRDLRGWTIKV